MMSVTSMSSLESRESSTSSSSGPMDAAAVRRLDAVGVVLPMTALVILDFVVIVGNSLVVTAVFTHSKLRRSTTNRFVVSLAAADLMVGIAVLPFSSINEVLHYWPFGAPWCRIWLAVDVWLCTASILNLCAISLDRYLAISRPFHYLSLMSSSRAKLLIVSVWILSFIICFPPLVGWNEKHTNATENKPMTSSVDNLTSDSFNASRLFVCELNSDPGYVIYSACGSFWFPMIVMVAFYWRIYRTATKATDAIRRGFITSYDNGAGIAAGRSKVTTESGYRRPLSSVSVSRSDNSIVGALRVHRGGGGVAGGHVTPGGLSPSLTSLTARHSNGSLADIRDYVQQQQQQQQQQRTPTAAVGSNGTARRYAAPMTSDQLPVNRRGARFRDQSIRQAKSEHDLPQIVVTSAANAATDSPGAAASTMAARLRTLSGSLSQLQWDGKKASPFSRLHQQLRSLNREKKAAKTVGIIVGCFIVCWAPFFTVYLVGAFCPGCTPSTLFDVFFWLGYCNSVANPIIYGLCSRDFRYAFVKLLRCRCERRRPPPLTLTGASTLRRHNSRIGTVLRSFRLQIATENRRDVTDSYS